jgi:uncharacterized protein (TIGR00369 family)
MKPSDQKGIVFIKKLQRGKVSGPPAADLIGCKVTAVKPGATILELVASQSHKNLMGTVHGGILCMMADTAMGMAFITTLSENETHTTLELKINFMRPAWEGRIRAIGKVVKRGKATGFVECEIVNDEDQLLAKASSTFMILTDSQANGREFVK